VVLGFGLSTPDTWLGTIACSPASSPLALAATNDRVGLSSPDRLSWAVCNPNRAATAVSVTDKIK